MPVRYGGLDTAEVSAVTGLDPDEIAEIHAAATYRVCARATAGQPLMGGTDPRLAVPRRPTPRVDVPALSVAVAGPQATIYSVLLPGGWSVIGTALVNVYDPHREQPFLLHLGDRVRFQAAPGEPPAPPTVRELLPAEPRAPALHVAEPGALDLVLDGGRLNQAHRGMAQSGPLDAPAASLANALCGNPPGTTLVESTLTGPTLVALRPLVVGVAGSGLRARGRRASASARRPPPSRRRAAAARAHRPRRARLPRRGGRDRGRGVPRLDERRPRAASLGRPLRAGDVLGLARDASPRIACEIRPRELPVAAHDPPAPRPAVDRGGRDAP